MKIVLAQCDPTIADFKNNAAAIVHWANEALTACSDADVVVFPELALCGYPPMDLLDLPGFADENREWLGFLEKKLPHGLAIGIGHVDVNREGRGKKLHDAYSVIVDGRCVFTQAKTLLPTYDVFDEARYFQSATIRKVWKYKGVSMGFAICEDLWHAKPDDPGVLYQIDPVAELCALGAELLIVPSASPFQKGKLDARMALAADAVKRHSVPIFYCNLCGGNDSLVFDGRSFAVDGGGAHIAQAGWEEGLLAIECEKLSTGQFALSLLDLSDGQKGFAHQSSEAHVAGEGNPVAGQKGLDGFPRQLSVTIGHQESSAWHARQVGTGSDAVAKKHAATASETIAHEHLFDKAALHADSESQKIHDIGKAIVVGLRGFAKKNGFTKACVGLSGGIDSALVAMLAAQALGAAALTCVSMPSRFSSEGSIADARQLCDNLGIPLVSIPIENVFNSALASLAPSFEGRTADTTEENLQARIRGLFLMALSNKFGSLLLATGNKSELSTGYCTLYGDMCGGLAPIGDLLKTEVYALSRYINDLAGYAIIPEMTLTKPPSAELRPDQRDQDSLPEYSLLDAVLTLYIEDNLTAQDIIAQGYEPLVVDKIISMVCSAEFKRRQAAPVIKISSRAFGTGRRIPIARTSFEQRIK